MSEAAEDQNEEDDEAGISRKALNELFAGTVQLAGLPVAAMGIINLIAIHYHVKLLPLGSDIIANYQLASHFLIGGLYWLPSHFLGFKPPLWFHDLAVISIVGSAISWKAFAGKQNWLTEWRGVSLNDMLYAATVPDDIEGFFDWLLYFVTVLPMFVTNLLAWVVGNVVFFVSRVRWLAGMSAAAIRVTLRGLFLIGLVIIVAHIKALIAPVSDNDVTVARRRAAFKYFLYFGVVLLAVFLFFARLGAEFLR